MTGDWVYRDAGIGHGIDSFYEYLLIAAIMFGDIEYYTIFVESYFAVLTDLKRGEVYIEADMNSGTVTQPVFNSLQAFFPSLQGTLPTLTNPESSLVTFKTRQAQQDLCTQYGDNMEELQKC
jgi:hypothetical protein